MTCRTVSSVQIQFVYDDDGRCEIQFTILEREVSCD